VEGELQKDGRMMSSRIIGVCEAGREGGAPRHIKKDSSNSQAGFSLLETVVATSLLATALVGLAQLLAMGTRTNAVARSGTFAAILAQQKMEQLRSLTWGFDASGLPLSDLSTDTTVTPESPTGGTGLEPSPPHVLRQNVNGYVDYLDARGISLGGGTSLPRGTVYVRRWSIEPLPTSPNETLVLQVLVRRHSAERRGAGEGTPSPRMPDEARLVSVKTRKTR